MKLQAEVVAFKGLIHVTEKQVAPSPKSKLVYFFAYSFITKRIMGKLLRYTYTYWKQENVLKQFRINMLHQ